MSYSLPNGDIAFSSGEYLSSNKMNKLTGNQSDIARFLNGLSIDVYDGTLTLQRNGVSIGTFTANSNTDKTINLIVPTTVAELSDEANYARANAIPTVSDATISVVVNGTTVGSFTLNQAQPQTITIPVDATLDTQSDNPVANAVVAAAIYELNGEIGNIEDVLHYINTGEGEESEGQSTES